MAAVNFPNNPSVNDTHTSSGSTWKWDGGVWQRLGVAGPQGAQGAQGRQGAVGAQGAQGVQGAGGSGGSAGAQGHQGVQGAAGSATISNNADNRVITGGSGTNLNGESALTFDGTTLTAAGSGGINISSSGADLTMNSAGSIFTGDGGNATDPAVANVSDTNTGYFYPAADTLAVTTGGSERVRITSAGKFGFGTDSPYLNKVTIKNDVSAGTHNWALHLLNGTHASDSRVGLAFQANNNAASNTWDGSGIYGSNDGVTGSCHLHFGTVVDGSFTERVRLKADGQIVKNQGANVTSLKTYNSNADAFTLDHYQYQVSSTYQRYTDIVSIGDGTWGSNIRFFTNTNGSANGIERFRITSSGTAAIGGNYTQTSNTLYVQGNPGIKVQGGTGSGGNANLLELKHPDTVSSGGVGDGPALLLNGGYQGNPWAFAKICSVNSGSGYGADFQIHVHPAGGTQGSAVVKALSIVGDGASGANVTITDGNLKVASGHGIDFSATADSSGGGMWNELLSDYEVGTFTPVTYGWSTATPYGGSNYNSGWYVKVGNACHVGWKVYYNTLSGSYSHIGVGGFPFIGGGNQPSIAAVRFDVPETAVTYDLIFYMGQGDNKVWLYQKNSSGTISAINASGNRSNCWTMGQVTYYV
jgi:hypothetical protein